MLDFIFIIGTSGIGKTTLSKGLFEYYKTVILEQNMVPEFISRDGIEDMTGELEERTCYENTKAMALCFHNLGYKNVVVADLDDLRTADIPIDFRNYKFNILDVKNTFFSGIPTIVMNSLSAIINIVLYALFLSVALLREIVKHSIFCCVNS